MSMEHVIYSGNGGEGFTLTLDEREGDYVTSIACRLSSGTLIPGDMTDMMGLFARSVRYAGKLKDQEDCLVFYMGRGDDLFAATKYYLTMHRITDRKLFAMFSHDSGRDYNWIKGQWK